MYKKLVLACLAICLFSALSAKAAEENNAQRQEEVLGIHPFKDQEVVSSEVTNWALYLQAGANMFDGDFSSEKKHAFNAPTVGLGFEYNFNPTWGIGAEYVFRRYGVTGAGGSVAVDGLILEGMMHQANAFITFDIFNCWRAINAHKLFALNLMLGGGMYWYNNSIYYPNTYKWRVDKATGNSYQTLDYQGSLNQPAQRMDKYKSDGVIMFGASFEFNVSRSIAVGVRATYNMTLHDELDGRVRGNNNDGVLDLTAMLRWKIDARKKSHCKNMVTFAQVEPVNNTEREVKKDTIVIYHKDTVYLIERHETTIIKEPAVVTQQFIEQRDKVDGRDEILDNSIPYKVIYFGVNGHELTEGDKATIYGAADKINTDDAYAVVVGYCDDSGTNELNNALGARRAFSVTKALLDYDVDETHVLPIGRGKIHGTDKNAWQADRRAEIHIMDEAAFRAEQIRYNDKKVMVGPGETFAHLARKYYKNTHCWVYIYLANQDIIPDPNDLEEGMIVFIPELDEDQKRITREETDALYKRSILDSQQK